LGAIRELNDIRFVWQYNGPALKDPPKNLFTAEWVPQQQILGKIVHIFGINLHNLIILAHPKCKGHLSHGGQFGENILPSIPLK
jgi:hypothetical protein